MADGTIHEYDLEGPIVLKFKNRQTVCNALVISGDNESLLGAIPFEDMPARPIRIPSVKFID